MRESQKDGCVKDVTCHSIFMYLHFELFIIFCERLPTLLMCCALKILKRKWKQYSTSAKNKSQVLVDYILKACPVGRSVILEGKAKSWFTLSLIAQHAIIISAPGGVKKAPRDKATGEKYLGTRAGKHRRETGDEVTDLRWSMGVFWGVHMYFQHDLIFPEGNTKQFVSITGKLPEETSTSEN